MNDEDYWLEKLNNYIWSVDKYEKIDDFKKEQVVDEIIYDEELWEFIEKKMDYYLTHPSIKPKSNISKEEKDKLKKWLEERE